MPEGHSHDAHVVEQSVAKETTVATQNFEVGIIFLIIVDDDVLCCICEISVD